jgi:hypothetical protein
MAPRQGQAKLDHMRWLVCGRSRNQECCLHLYSLLQKYPDRWSGENSYAASNLVGAAFSLWRAVFLGEKEGSKQAEYQHLMLFLANVIEDNSISYVQDKRNNEWTFNYYVDNARLRLTELRNNWKKVVPEWEVEPRTPTERWDYAQTLLSTTVENMDQHFANLRRQS